MPLKSRTDNKNLLSETKKARKVVLLDRKIKNIKKYLKFLRDIQLFFALLTPKSFDNVFCCNNLLNKSL